MMKRGFLAANSVYACVEYKSHIINESFDLLEPILATIQECEAGRTIDDLLNGPVCHAGFKRLS